MICYLPLVVICSLFLLTVGGRLRPAWRYTSLGDAISILCWSAAAAVVQLVWRLFLDMVVSGREHHLHIVPFSVILLDLLLSFLGLVGVRVAVRWWSEYRERGRARHARLLACQNSVGQPSRLLPLNGSRQRTLLIGAGSGGRACQRNCYPSGPRHPGCRLPGRRSQAERLESCGHPRPRHDLSVKSTGAGVSRPASADYHRRASGLAIRGSCKPVSPAA